MKNKTLRDVIRETTAAHLDAGHLVMGQNLSAVGFVANTVPDHPGLTELPMSDVANSGFAVGSALAGHRPIYIVRYQGFQHLNAAMIVNYAAKSRALWGRTCPLLVRSIAMEGGIGPTSGSSHHSLFTRMPGVRVIAPMTPGEWRAAYEEWMEGDEVVYLSEHRGAYDNAEEMFDCVWGGSQNLPHPEVVLFPISITRFAALEMSKDDASVRVYNVKQLKPFSASGSACYDLSMARHGGIVLDDDYAGGVASDIALQLHALTGARMRVLALADRTAGFGPGMDNLPPDKDRIKAFIKEQLR